METIREFDAQKNLARLYDIVDVIDKDTGEKRQETVYKGTVYYGQESFVRLHQEAFFDGMPILTRNAMLLLFFLLKMVNRKDNTINMTMAKMAKNSRIPTRSVEKAMMELEALDYIRCGGHADWMLNPFIHYGYYDSERKQAEELYQTYPTFRDKQEVRLWRKEFKKDAD